MEQGEFTETLARCREGDAGAQHRLIDLVYADLKQVARRHLRGNRWIATLDTTSLLHESYLRLAGDGSSDVASRAHYLNLASRVMRQVVCDHARKRLRQRAHAETVLLDEEATQVVREAREVVSVDEALVDLARAEPRQAQVVECRFFGGLTVEETAEALGLSVRTVERDWSDARDWLAAHLAVS